MQRNIWAVVVTYNRLELLKECINALLGQTVECKILIVDNNSSDKTEEYCRDICQSHDNIFCKRLSKNLGGAGGFSQGMKYAVENGADYVWIMDDDTIPNPDTLEKLAEAADGLESDGELNRQTADVNSKYGFLSSEVLWTDGNPCRMNAQLEREARNPAEKALTDRLDLTPVESATFVSLMFPAEVIIRFGLPIEEYFIWGDDKEYTLRISSELPCYKVRSSRVTHKMKNNEGSSITYDDIDRIGRYFYAYRNDYCTAKRQGFKAVAIYHMAFALNFCRILLHASYKKQRIETMNRGRKAGRHFRPEIKYPEM